MDSTITAILHIRFTALKIVSINAIIHDCSVVGGADDDQEARQGCQDGQRFVDGRPDKGQNQGDKSREDDPIQHDPQLTGVLG